MDAVVDGMTAAEEAAWDKKYAAASPGDQRRALYGRRVTELVHYVKAHASEYEDNDLRPLIDAARPQVTRLLEATADLTLNLLGMYTLKEEPTA